MPSFKNMKNALDEVKEDIILHNYNDAMMLMAQITIDVIEHLADENLIVSKGYQEDLQVLLAGNKISDSTGHNFETLIISGVQAHNGVQIPEEHAKKALEVLEAELNDLSDNESMPLEVNDDEAKARVRAENGVPDDVGGEDVFSYDDENDQPAFLSQDDDEDFRLKERLRQEQIAQQSKKIKLNKRNLIILVLPIVLIILFAALIRSCMSNMASQQEETTIPTTEYIPIIETTETEPTTTTTIAGYYRVTTDLLNVRAEANTSSAIRGRVNTGETVYVEGFYDDQWAIIRYEGRNAYVSRQYLVKIENQAVAPEVNEE